MTDYYFISSPLHLCLAANISLGSPGHHSVALIITRDQSSANSYIEALDRLPVFFNTVVSLTLPTGLKAIFRKGHGFKQLQDLFSQPGSKRIFTGNDRRIEFQYAMHIASKTAGDSEGIYLDDGAVTYVGHKSMKTFQHRIIDPLIKKIFLGHWWKSALTTGSSGWISSAYVAFPKSVHPCLKKKKLFQVSSERFKSAEFKALTVEFLKNAECLKEQLAQTDILIVLPHEAGFRNNLDVYREFGRLVTSGRRADRIAVKVHPRAKDMNLVNECFDGSILLEGRIGMEFMLPFVHDRCLVLGDISTSLLTSKWLNPCLRVRALNLFSDIPGPLLNLYAQLDIAIINLDDLSALLKEEIDEIS